MNSLPDTVRGRFPQSCEAEECRDADCSASLDGIDDDRLLIDLDCDELGLASERRADFILVTGAREVSCVELKSGALRHAVEQLQASAEYVETRLVNGETNLMFFPVLVHRQEFGPARVRQWAKRQISFRDVQFAIRRVTCGESLAKAFQSSS